MPKNAVRFIAIACAVALLDGVFKFLAHRLINATSIVQWPIDFSLHKNPGITFNIPLPLAVVVPLSCVICLGLLTFARRAKNTEPYRAASAIIIVIGAAGNIIDRLVNQYTTDYLIFFTRSAINLSDLLIVLGAAGLVYYTQTNSHRRT